MSAERESSSFMSPKYRNDVYWLIVSILALGSDRNLLKPYYLVGKQE